MSDNLIPDSIKQLTQVEAAKNERAGLLKTDAAKWRGMSGNPFMLFALFMMGVLSTGSSYQSQVEGVLPGTKKGASIIGCQEDRIREVAVQKTVTNAYSATLSQAQKLFNDAKNDPTIQPEQIQAKLQSMIDGLNSMPATGSPFDAASKSTLVSSLSSLNADLDNVRAKWGSLGNMYAAAGTAGDKTGASTMIKDINNHFGTVSTISQTVSNTTSTKMQLVNADYQQFLGLLNTLLQDFHKNTNASIQNQTSG